MSELKGFHSPDLSAFGALTHCRHCGATSPINGHFDGRGMCKKRTKTFYNKLVRDRVPERIEKTGKVATIHTLSVEAFQGALAEKLREESQEVDEAIQCQDLNAALSELADAQAVLDHLLYSLGFTSADLQAEMSAKYRSHGRFANRTYLISVSDREEPCQSN